MKDFLVNIGILLLLLLVLVALFDAIKKEAEISERKYMLMELREGERD